VLNVGLVAEQAVWLVEAERLLRQWQAAGRNRPTALIALEDGWAHAVSTEMRALGMRVPDDLELAGFDNLTIAAHIRPRYLTTAPDLRRAGALAVELAQAAISGELAQPYSYVLPVPVVERVFEGDKPVIRPLES
jgi:LacI family transcriptional regulator